MHYAFEAQSILAGLQRDLVLWHKFYKPQIYKWGLPRQNKSGMAPDITWSRVSGYAVARAPTKLGVNSIFLSL